jgi:tetratricopeptide (TPR) repeat protein
MAARVLRSAVKRAKSARLVRQIFSEIINRSTHFTSLAAEFGFGLLKHERAKQHRDRSLEAMLLFELSQQNQPGAGDLWSVQLAEEAVRHFRRLRGASEGSEENLTEALLGLTTLLSNSGRAVRAIRIGREAAARASVATSHRRNQLHGNALVSLGGALFVAGKFADAERTLREGYRLLARGSRPSEVRLSNLATAASMLALLYLRLGRVREAGRLASRAWTFHSRLVSNDSGSYLLEYLESSQIYALAASRLGQKTKADAIRGESILHLSQLLARQPRSFAVHFAFEVIFFGVTCYEEEDYEAAFALSVPACRLGRKLAQTHSEQGIVVCAAALTLQASICLCRNQGRRALRLAQEICELVSRLPEGHSSRLQFSQAMNAAIEVLQAHLPR